MTWDSNDQYAQAISGRYNDWFPPIMAVLWRQLLRVTPWGTGLLLLHLGLWWGSLLVLARTLAAAGKRGAAWIMLASGAFPAMLLLNSFILKDVGLTATLMMAFAIIFAHRARVRDVTLLAWIGIALLLGYAALVRQNGAAAVAPLICYAAAPRRTGRPVPLLVASAVICLLVIGLSGPINHRVFGARDAMAKRSLILFDVTGIAYHSRDPGVFRRDVNPPQAVIDRCYSVARWDELGKQPCDAVFGAKYVPTRTLVRAIVAHPVAYAEHRIAHWNSELFFLSPVDDWKWYDTNRLPGEPRAWNDGGVKHALSVLSNLPPFAPALAFALLAVLAGLMIRNGEVHASPSMEATFFLAASGLFYALSFLPAGVANMYRYYEPVLAACITCLIIYFASASAAQRRTAKRWLLPTAGIILLVASVGRLTL